jgi:hypothetical protein
MLSAGNVHRVQRCIYALFSLSLMQAGEKFVCHENGSPDEMSIFLAEQNR